MKIKRLCLILLVVAVCACSGLGISRLVTPVAADSIELAASDVIPDSKQLNSTLELPESVSVSLGGSDYTAIDGIVVRPDGKAVAAAGMHTLDQKGVYVVKYFFNANGVKNTAYKNVNVHSDYYELQNGGGSTLTKTESLATGKKGVTLDLNNGATFAYSKAVDLSKVNTDGLAEIIEFDNRSFHSTDAGIILDCKEVWVRLTDCYNPNIYAEFVMGRWHEYGGTAYSGVQTYCQPITGLDVGHTANVNDVEITIDGTLYSLWPNDIGHMALGVTYSTALTHGMRWQYDYEQMRFYASYTTGSGSSEKTVTRLVTDLDDPKVQQKTGVLFPGWTTGEVFLSVYGAEYGAGSASVEINSIGGEEIYDFIDQEYADDIAPNITVHAKKTTLSGVYGAVGDTVFVPNASATDVNLVGGTEYSVFRSYGTSAQTNVSVKNGAFKLEKSDAYTVVYTAKDSYGNIGKALFNFIAIDAKTDRAISLDFAEVDSLESLTAGVEVDLTATVTENLNGSASDVDVKVSVESARQSEKFGANGKFVPLYAETYTITYAYTDGIYNYERLFTFECTVDDSVVSFYGDVELPVYFLKGARYAINTAKAYSYIGGKPNAVNVTTYAVFNDNEADKVLVENVDNTLISGDNSVYFIYEAEGATPVKSRKVEIIDAATSTGKIDASKLFVGDDFEKVSGVSGLKFATTKSNGSAKMTFFNPISPKFFSLNYKVLDSEANFDTLVLTLTDSVDLSVRLTISISFDGTNSFASINGGSSAQLKDFKFTDTSFKSITYYYSTRKLSIGGSNYFLDADFSSSVYFSLEMLNLTGVSSIEISKLNNQSFSAEIEKDAVKPEIYVSGFYGFYGVGSVVKTAIPEFNDVLSGIDPTSIKMTIGALDGKPVYDKNGNLLSDCDWTKEYEIKIDRIVKYYVSFTVADFAGNKANSSITVSGVDSSAPEITLNNMKEGGIIHIKVCGTVTLNFTVSDDTTSPEDLMTYVHLYCDDLCSFVGNITDISNDSEDRPEDGVYDCSFQICLKGNYTAQIHCYDEQGNHSVTRIAIVVE